MDNKVLDEAVEVAVRTFRSDMSIDENGCVGPHTKMRAALIAGVKVLLGEPVAWTTAKPTEPGAYWVKGYSYGRPSEKALVEVRLVGGELCSNLHAVNSDNDTDDFDALARHNDSFQWAGPLIYAPSLGEGDGR